MKKDEKKEEQREIPATNEIQMYMHCALCIQENIRPPKIGVGWTKLGLQVWCEHHDANMMHIDFEGAKHPANMARKLRPHETRCASETERGPIN